MNRAQRKVGIGLSHEDDPDSRGSPRDTAPAAKKRPARRREKGNGGRGARSGLRNGISIGLLALVIAMVLAGPIGAILTKVDALTGFLILAGTISVAILADVLAIAATAGSEAPFNAMASKRVPGAREALVIVRNAGRVNSLCADVIGDISGTLGGVVATPIILSLSQSYQNLSPTVVSMGVIGLIAFFTIGGKAAEKAFSVRASTSIILIAGKAMYYASRWRRPRRRHP